MADRGRRSIELDGRDMMRQMVLEVRIRNEPQAIRRFRRWAWIIALGCRSAGLGGIRAEPDLPSITDTPAVCETCEWQGTAGECEPDIDGDGSLGCPRCGAVVVCEGDGEPPAERPAWD